MSQPASNNNGPSKMNKLLAGNVDQNIKARLPRAGGAPPPAVNPPKSEPAVPAAAPVVVSVREVQKESARPSRQGVFRYGASPRCLR